MDLDNDFLLMAYQDYFNVAEEWPFFKNIPDHEKYTGNDARPMPLLMRECARLIPVKDPKTGYLNFHPMNMPNTMLRKINIIGAIVGLKSNATYIEIDVCDATGTMSVLYKQKNYEDEVNRREEIDRKHGIAAKDVLHYESLMKQIIVDNGRKNPAIQRRKQLQKAKQSWWNECKNGMLGKPLDLGNYVNVFGFCNLKRNKSNNSNEKANFWDCGALPTMIFNAYDVKSITEKEYHDKLEKWINGIVKKKYIA